MKKRNRARRLRRKSSRGNVLNLLQERAAQRRRTWTFERLEDRHMFSTTPVDVQVGSLSSATAEGAAALLQREIAWSLYQQALGAAMADGSTVLNVVPNSLPTDPYFLPDANDPTRASQWHLLNVGQQVGNPDFQVIYGTAGEDINVVPVWQGEFLQQPYTGKGVTVAVIDTGVQLTHPDLVANLDPILRLNALTGSSNPNPFILNPDNAHGTAVAGLIAADDDGKGTVGVAPDATLVPILLLANNGGTTAAAIENAFRYAIQDVDITNNSWGEGGGRTAVNLPPNVVLALRDSIIFGRDGLGVIHVFSSGNSAGPGFSPPFESIGNLDYANYDALLNSRYTIPVTAVDHDGLYANVDGTFTAYPEIGVNVFVAAPTGSNAFLNIADDTGLGSGIVTTDFTGENGFNISPINGVEIDRDFLNDPNYTSRFNGTSAAAPLVSGVIALMLEANPNLNWRDVQEILVRSARQNSQFEVPESGAGFLSQNTWQINQLQFLQDPDPFTSAGTSGMGITDPDDPEGDLLPDPAEAAFRRLEVYDPIADPSLHGVQQWTNAAGYTFSNGYGVYGESIGYAHGVIDAALAVKMAENWHSLGQNRNDELTFSTFVVNLAGGGDLPGAEKANMDAGQLLVPGLLGGDGGFIDFWNEYFEEDDPNDDDDGPFSGDDPPTNTRGSFFEFSVPENNAMTVESIEFKFGMSGPSDDLDQLRFVLVSPEGTFSEFNPFVADGGFLPFSLQGNNINAIGDLGTLDPDGEPFTWTFNTVVNWGESSSNALVMDPATGEPALFDISNFGLPTTSPTGTAGLTEGWRVFIENWSGSDFHLDAMELTFHGNPIQAGTHRVQGIVGVDENNDGDFNFTRYIQTVGDSDGDPLTIRLNDVQRFLDPSQEDFAENILVSAYRVFDGIPEPDPVARFITGHDGNYYFDLLPGEYVVRATDLDDPNTPLDLMSHTNADGLLPHYLAEWHITEDWFLAPDRDADYEIMVDDDGVPIPFEDGNGIDFAYGPRYLNFLIDPGDLPPDTVEVSGSVIADLNANGVLDGDDAPAAGFFVYHDANRNGANDAGENLIAVDGDGTYSIILPATAQTTLAVGVVPPNSDWLATNPGTGVQSIFAGPGDSVDNINFFFRPPLDQIPDPAGNDPGDILGVVFSDRNGNGVRQAGDHGAGGFRVYVDANENGAYDTGEIFSITADNGAYFLANVPKGLARVDIVVPDSWMLTAPAAGFREINVPSGGTVTNVLFGVRNLATGDFGDLPDSYGTTIAANGPRHEIIAGFQLGAVVDGEANGQPTADAMGDDAVSMDEDGVILLGSVTNPTGVMVPNALNSVRVSVSGVGGYLNAWMDFNRNGSFDAGEQVFTDLDLNPGTHTLSFAVPNLTGGPIAARFRWGTAGLSFVGPAPIGEVEDYMFDVLGFAPVSAPIPGDFDGSGTVDNADYDMWRAAFGTVGPSPADGNGDGVVDNADYVLWRMNKGASGAGGGSGSGSSLNTFSIAQAKAVTGGLTNGVSASVAAQLESLGYVPMTIRVGDQVRTVYRLPELTASLASHDLAGDGDLAAAVTTLGNVPARVIDNGSLRVTPLQVDAAVNRPDVRSAFVSASSEADNTAAWKLRLLDHVLAGLASSNGGEDGFVDPMVADKRESQEHDLEPELAAVFDEDINWRCRI